jgi:hypothetical protein
MTMGTWKTRLIAKKSKGKSESGRSKGLVPPPWARHCAKAARAYKTNPRYGEWCTKCDGSKIKWSSK